MSHAPLQFQFYSGRRGEQHLLRNFLRVAMTINLFDKNCDSTKVMTPKTKMFNCYSWSVSGRLIGGEEKNVKIGQLKSG